MGEYVWTLGDEDEHESDADKDSDRNRKLLAVLREGGVHDYGDGDCYDQDKSRCAPEHPTELPRSGDQEDGASRD